MSNELIMMNPLDLVVMYEHARLQSGKLIAVQSLSRSQLYTQGTAQDRNLSLRA